MKSRRLLLAFALFVVPALAQFTWPTYPVHIKVQIYKIMKDNGSGLAVLDTNDSGIPLGIAQNAVVTSVGNVALATVGPSLVQVGATPVVMGNYVASDVNSNVVPFAPPNDGAVHCSVGTVIGLNGGTGAANSFVYVNVKPDCSQFSSSGGGGVTSFNTRTGAVVSVSGDYTVGQVTGAAPLASPTFSGTVNLGTGTNQFSSTEIIIPLCLTNQVLYLKNATPDLGCNNRFQFNGTSVVTVGGAGSGNGEIDLVGNTSGTASIVGPAVAGTPANPVVFSNAIQTPAVSTPEVDMGATGVITGGVNGTIAFGTNDASDITLTPDTTHNSTMLDLDGVNGDFALEAPDGSVFTSPLGGTLNLTGGTNGIAVSLVAGGSLAVTSGGVVADSYASTTHCASAASPAACGSSPAGFFTIAAAATTKVVNTTAVTATSQIFIFPDETLGAALTVTCNTTLAQAAAGLAVTSRTAGTSFTVTTLGAIAVNPACYSYLIIN